MSSWRRFAMFAWAAVPASGLIAGCGDGGDTVKLPEALPTVTVKESTEPVKTYTIKDRPPVGTIGSGSAGRVDMSKPLRKVSP